MSPFESVIVLPQLSDSRAASSSAFFSTRSASLNRSLPRSAASIVLQGPDSRRLARGLDRPVDVGRTRRRDLGDHLAGRRVVCLELTAIAGVHPLIVDEQLGQPNLRPGRHWCDFRGHDRSSMEFGEKVSLVEYESSSGNATVSRPRSTSRRLRGTALHPSSAMNDRFRARSRPFHRGLHGKLRSSLACSGLRTTHKMGVLRDTDAHQFSFRFRRGSSE